MSDCDCRRGARCLEHIEADGLTLPSNVRTVRLHVPHWPNIMRRAQRALVHIYVKGASNGRGSEEEA